MAPTRIPCFFHADDPVLLASSAREMQWTLEVASDWARQHQASFHVGDNKSALLAAGVDDALTALPDVGFTLADGSRGPPLRILNNQKHLGIIWDVRLCFEADMHAKIHSASREFASLCGLVAARSVPLSLALELFTLKVESLLVLGRWLWATEEGAPTALDTCMEGWARSLLGAEPWRNAVVAQSELGWHLGGFPRSVRSVAVRQACLWCLSSGHTGRRSSARASSKAAGRERRGTPH